MSVCLSVCLCVAFVVFGAAVLGVSVRAQRLMCVVCGCIVGVFDPSVSTGAAYAVHTVFTDLPASTLRKCMCACVSVSARSLRVRCVCVCVCYRRACRCARCSCTDKCAWHVLACVHA